MPISNIVQHNADDQMQTLAVQPQPARISPLVQQQSGDGITRVKDSNGRQIGVRPVTAIDMFDTTMALGEHASNAALFRQAMVAAAAVEFDGVHLPRPTSMITIRARIQILGFPGFVAVSEALAAAAVSEAINPEAVKI